MLQFAHAHEHGVQVKDETGIHFIPYSRRRTSKYRHAAPALDPEGTDSPYRCFSPPLRHSVLPSAFHLGQLHVRISA
jgi:hypothetical protein